MVSYLLSLVHIWYKSSTIPADRRYWFFQFIFSLQSIRPKIALKIKFGFINVVTSPFMFMFVVQHSKLQMINTLVHRWSSDSPLNNSRITNTYVPNCAF